MKKERKKEKKPANCSEENCFGLAKQEEVKPSKVSKNNYEI